MDKAGRVFLFGKEAQDALLAGAEITYKTVATTFGPRGRNVLAKKPFGMPRLTRDGVTVARETYLSDDPTNMGTQLLLEASETTNRVAGDGTSATVVLGYHLMKHGLQAIAAGTHPMVVRDIITDDATLLLNELDKIAKPIKKSQLEQVASVSSGDPLLGKLIAEAIEKVGPDGGINAEKYPVESVEREYMQGYYLQVGFQALQSGKKELHEPMVLIVQKRIASAIDIGEILERARTAKNLQPGRDPMKFLLIGNIDGAAHNHVVDLINRGAMDAILIKTPPQFGEMGNALLEDIAIYTGCEPISESTNLREIGEEHVGTVDKAVASKNEATLYGDNSGELVQDRIAEIKEQIQTEIGDAVVEKLRDRIAKLEGKIALFKIGGATETEKEEKADRVEDAILAARGAVSHGVVPGGGATWLVLSNTPTISTMSKDALRAVFRKLLTNANLPAEVKLDEALKAKPGTGYNLRESDELVDMVESGVLDSKKVVEQVIRNASTFAGSILTTDVLIVDEKDKDGKIVGRA